MIIFPDPDSADENGLLAMGGDLEVDSLLAAYGLGIFPWYAKDQPLLWWSPDPRMVLFPDAFHISKRLQRRLNQPQYHFSCNQAFEQVIHCCANVPRKDQQGTWIFAEMIAAYMELHRQKHAYSFEVWQGDILIGGLYGVFHKQVFFAESMFHLKTDASKMAMANLVEYAQQHAWKIIDCQFYTKHLASLGAREISRQHFREILA